MENTGYYKILSSISKTTGLKQIQIDGKNIDFTPFIHIVVDSDALYSSDFNFNFSDNDLYSCLSNDVSYVFKETKENNSRVSYFFDSIPAYKEYPLAFCYNTENSSNNNKKKEINAKTLHFGSISTELKFKSIKNSSTIDFSSKSIQVNSLSSIPANNNNSVDINSLSGVITSYEFSGYSAEELGFVIDDTNNKISHLTDNIPEDIFITKKNNKYIISPIEGKEINELEENKTYFGFAINLDEFSEINDGNNGVVIEALSSGHTKIYCDELIEIGE